MTFFTRLAAAALVGLGAVSAAGCDSSDTTEATTGPTVQFGSASLTVAEGDTAAVPVTLTGATAGQVVTVDVLFAAASSSACSETDTSADNEGECALPTADDSTAVDFYGFGAVAPFGNRVQTVTLTAGDDGTATTTVAVDVADDGAIEPGQTAVFALQNVTAGVGIGVNRQISLVIGSLPLSTIRQLPDGAEATVEGVVTRARGRLTYIQDGTGALAIFSPVTSEFGLAVASGEIAPGDRIQVAGTIDIFNGLTEITFVTEFGVIVEDAGIPTPQTVSLAQITADVEAYESELLRIPGLTIQTTDVVFPASSTNYTVSDASGATYTLRVVGGTDGSATNTPVPVGPTTFTGVLGQFNTGQLLVIDRSDLNP